VLLVFSEIKIQIIEVMKMIDNLQEFETRFLKNLQLELEVYSQKKLNNEQIEE
jgi:hypothetical protein